MLQEAAQRLQEAVRLLEVEGRGSRLASLQRQLVARRCRLAAAYGAVYAVGPKTGLPLLCVPLPFTQASALRCLTISIVYCSESHCEPLPSAQGVWAQNDHSLLNICAVLFTSLARTSHLLLVIAACSDRSGFAVTEPEPPPGGFLWDLMDLLWFTGAALASHPQYHLG